MELAEGLQEDDNIEPKEIKPYFMAFNSMDRAVKHGNGYTIGLAMHSERTAAFESINDENHNAYHTSDGMLYTYKRMSRNRIFLADNRFTAFAWHDCFTRVSSKTEHQCLG